VTEELKRFALLGSLGEEERGDLAEELEWLSCETGVALFREGEHADALLLLLEGRVRVTSRRAGAEGECGPGTAFGALSLVVDGQREATAITASPCRVLRLRRSSFRRLVDAAPHAACALLEGVARESAAEVREVLDRLALG
jgi:CRP-like cAMP-binding protein